MISLLILLAVLILFSALFSMCEMAYVSSDKARLRQLVLSGSRSAKRVLALHDKPHDFMTSILIANNIVNVFAVMTATYLFQRYARIENEWVITAVMAPLLIVFGELVPKDFGRVHAMVILLRFSPLIIGLQKMLGIVTRIVTLAVDGVMKSVVSDTKKSIFVSEREFRSLIEESVKHGIVSTHEKKIIDTILDFEKVYVGSVMIPVAQVPKIDIHSNLKEARRVAREFGFPMLLVYEEDPSIIMGMIYVFDLLFESNPHQALKPHLRSPIFLSQGLSVERAFIEMKERRQSFALVTDAEGEVIGAVPIERLFIWN